MAGSGTSSGRAATHEFGPFRYDPAQRVLFRGADPVPLMPKAVDTLHALIERRGEVVEKAELMRLVWPDCTVEEIGLARNISLLRKALGDEYIETVPKRGYRFAAAEAAAPVGATHGRRALWIALAVLIAGVLVYWQFYASSRFVPRTGYAVLAVAPFETLDGSAPEAGFARAFAESLVTEVNRTGAAQVISPGTVSRYRDLRVPVAFMTRVLGAQVVVEGSVRQAEGKFRINVRLSDVHSGKLIWAENYSAAADGADAARAAAISIAARLRNAP